MKITHAKDEAQRFDTYERASRCGSELKGWPAWRVTQDQDEYIVELCPSIGTYIKDPNHSPTNQRLERAEETMGFFGSVLLALGLY